MNLEIDLPVFHMTDEQQESYDLGIDIDLKDCKIITYTFYQIGNLKPIDERSCSVQSEGVIYVINMCADKVKELIRDKRLPFLN